MVQGRSQAEYLPNPGYVGDDDFRVQTSSTGGSMAVHVNVVAVPGAAAPAPAGSPATPAQPRS